MRSFLSLLSTLFLATLFAQAPTVPPASVNFSSITGGSVRFNVTPGDGQRRLVVFRQGSPVTGTPANGVDYNPDLNFGDGDVIATDEFSVADVNTTFPLTVRNLIPATTYHVAVFEYNGSGQNTEYLTTPLRASFMTLAQPTQNVSSPQANDITGNSYLASWTNGNGDGRILTMRKGGPVTANPVDLTSYSGGIGGFGNGTVITPGNIVAYSTTSQITTSRTITGLEPATVYHGSWHEFNGPGGAVYTVPGETFSFTTATRPTVAATYVRDGLSPAEGDRYEMDYYDGNGRGRLVVVTQGSSLAGVQPTDGVRYNDNTNFGAGDEVEPGVFALQEFNSRQFNPTGNNTSTATVRDLQPGTTYTIGVYEFDRSDDYAVINYQTIPPLTHTFTTAGAPSPQASAGFVTQNNGTTARLKWTSGGGDGELVVVKAGAPVDLNVVDLRTYGINPSFGFSDLGNGNFGVYRGNRDSVDLTNLTAGTEYHVAIWSYNGLSGPVYATPPHRFVFTASLKPTISSTDVRIITIEGDRLQTYARPGNGQKRLVVVKAGGPPQGQPQDGTSYNADLIFGQGATLGPDEYVVYSGTGASAPQTRITVTGLEIGTDYHFAYYEFNEDAAGQPFYRQTAPGRENESTATIPTELADSISILNLNAVSVSLRSAPGNGARRLLVLAQDNPFTWQPTQLIRYNTNSQFGVGNAVAPLVHPVSFSPNPQINVANLEPNTTYYAGNFEANGSNFPVYNQTPTVQQFTTLKYPTDPGSGLEVVDIGATEVTGRYFRGNGSGRIATLRLLGSPSVNPVDDVEYTADATFGQGDDLGNGNFVVGSDNLYRPGNRINYRILGLQPGTTYVINVYELARKGNTNVYYAVPGLTDTVTTVSRPTVAPINLQANDVLAESATIAWTTGNGQGEYILMSANAPVNALQQDGQPAPASSNWNPNFTNLGNARGMYWGTRTEVNITNLTPGTPYYVRAQAWNGVRNSAAYMQSGPTLMFRTPGAPSIQASDARITRRSPGSLSLQWAAGNGTDRILIAKKDNPVDETPVDDIIYTPNTFFGSGDELGSGNFVIATGDFDTITVTNLMAGSVYYFAVFEYNVDQSVLYNTDAPARTDNAASLPVRWEYVHAQPHNKSTAKVSWGTAVEENNAGFTIERAPARGEFRSVGEQSPRLGGRYVFFDADLSPGDYLYRIRQTDFDGTVSYSAVVPLRLTGSKLSVYPNPSEGRVRIVGVAAGAVVEIKEPGGTSLRRAILRDGTVDLSDLSSGLYLLQIGEEVVRVIKR